MSMHEDQNDYIHNMDKKTAITFLYAMLAENLNLDDLYIKNRHDALTFAIRWLEQEPCDDILTLSKQVVTQVTEDIDNFIFTTIRPWCEEKEQRKISKHDLEQALIQYFSKDKLPSVIPQQKTGKSKWIEERTYMECPNCGDIWHYEENQTERFKCCPTCGKNLVESKESEEEEK